MKKSFAAIGVGFASLLSCHGAIAEAPNADNAWYVQASAGRAWLNDMAGDDHQVLLSNGHQTTTSRMSELGSNKTFDIAVGRVIGNGLRADIEYAYRTNIIDKLLKTDPPPTTVLLQDDSEVSSHSLLANVYYDFRNSSPITPYLGLGLGVARITTQWTAVSGTDRYRFEDSDWTYAGQLTAGAKWAITLNWGIFAQYRYFMAPDFHTSASVIRGNAIKTQETLSFKDDYISQSFSLGVRYSF